MRRETRGEEGSKTAKENLNLQGAIPLSGSAYHIRGDIKLYIVLDEILTLFETGSRPRINAGLWTSVELMHH